MMIKKKLARDIAALTAAILLPCSVFAAEVSIEEIIVTAQKRAQAASDIGVAINAFSREDIKALGLATSKDLAAQTPGLNTANSQSGGVPVFAIRGIGLDDFNINNSSGVGVYTDQVYASSPAFLNFQMMDIEAVEVLKGPQGTLYGKNTTGGAITFVTTKPSEEFDAYITSKYSRFDRYEVEAAVGGEIVDGVNGRLAVSSVDQRKGSQKNQLNGAELGKDDKQAFRGQLQFGLGDTTDVLLNVHGGRDNSVSESPISQDGEDIFGTGLTLDRRNPAANIHPVRDEEGYGAAITIDSEFDGFTLTSITAWDDYQLHNFDNMDGSSISLSD